jgi:hypothetical protein
MLSAGRNIIKNEGFLALYNGLLPSLLRDFAKFKL